MPYCRDSHGRCAARGHRQLRGYRKAKPAWARFHRDRREHGEARGRPTTRMRLAARTRARASSAVPRLGPTPASTPRIPPPSPSPAAQGDRPGRGHLTSPRPTAGVDAGRNSQITAETHPSDEPADPLYNHPRAAPFEPPPTMRLSPAPGHGPRPPAQPVKLSATATSSATAASTATPTATPTIPPLRD